MSTGTFTYAIDVNGYEYELDVEYTSYPGYKGACEGGQKVEPDEDSSIEIEGCKWGELDFPLCEGLVKEIEEAIMLSGD